MNQKDKCIQYLDSIRNLNKKAKQYLTVTVLERTLEQDQKNFLEVFKKFQKILDKLENIFQTIVNFNLRELCNNLIKVLEVNTLGEKLKKDIGSNPQSC